MLPVRRPVNQNPHRPLLPLLPVPVWLLHRIFRVELQFPRRFLWYFLLLLHIPAFYMLLCH